MPRFQGRFSDAPPNGTKAAGLIWQYRIVREGDRWGVREVYFAPDAPDRIEPVGWVDSPIELEAGSLEELQREFARVVRAFTMEPYEVDKEGALNYMEDIGIRAAQERAAVETALEGCVVVRLTPPTGLNAANKVFQRHAAYYALAPLLQAEIEKALESLPMPEGWSASVEAHPAP